MGCMSGMSKCLLSLFNLIFFIAGTILLGVGIWLAIDKSSFIVLLRNIEHQEIEKFTAPALVDQFAYVLIACGAATFIISFLGYCGALRESSCLLTLYASLMIIILLAEIALGCAIYAMKDETKVETKKLLMKSIEKYNYQIPHQDIVSLAWDNTMISLSCCGVDNYKDFDQAKDWVDKKNTTIPVPCCKFKDKRQQILEDDTCPNKPTDANSNQNYGCYEAALDWINGNIKFVIIGVIVVAVTEVILIMLSLILCSSINRYRRMQM